MKTTDIRLGEIIDKYYKTKKQYYRKYDRSIFKDENSITKRVNKDLKQIQDRSGLTVNELLIVENGADFAKNRVTIVFKASNDNSTPLKNISLY